MSGNASGRRITRAPVVPHWRSGNVTVEREGVRRAPVDRRSTVRRAMNRANAGAHIAMGTRPAHARELTVHPLADISAAIAVVIPTETAANTIAARHAREAFNSAAA